MRALSCPCPASTVSDPKMRPVLSAWVSDGFVTPGGAEVMPKERVVGVVVSSGDNRQKILRRRGAPCSLRDLVALAPAQLIFAHSTTPLVECATL